MKTKLLKKYARREPDIRIIKGEWILVENYTHKTEFFGHKTDPRIRKLVAFIS